MFVPEIKVTRPFESTVVIGTLEALPYNPAVAPEAASVRAVAPVASPVWSAFVTKPL
jgi:hypothetical protein